MYKRLKFKAGMILSATLIMFSFLFISCQEESVRLAGLDSDYTNLGLTKGTIALWEDGARMDYTQEEFCFEWWYFDGTFDDGASFVASFYSRIDMDPTKPFIKLSITTPDGENINRVMWGDFADSSFSSVQCDLNIGDNNVVKSENGTTYYIKSQVEDLAVDLVLQRTVKSFRQDTGHILIGNDEDHYLGWFSMVPRGTLNGTITYNGETHAVTGMGYHDHNWGTVALQDVIKDWWWMRGYVDGVAIIAYDFGFKDKYGSKHIPIYGIMNSTDILAVADSSTVISGDDLGFPDDPGYSTCLSDRIPLEINIQTGDCGEGESCIQNQFLSENLVESIDLAAMQDLTDFEITMMKLLSIDPWYTRYTGTVNLEVEGYNGWSTSGTGTAIIEYLDLE